MILLDSRISRHELLRQNGLAVQPAVCKGADLAPPTQAMALTRGGSLGGASLILPPVGLRD